MNYTHRYNCWKTVEELDQGAEAISDFEELVEKRGHVPSYFTDTEADKYYYAEQENSVSVSKGPSAMGGRGFGFQRQGMGAQLSPAKQALASTLVAADLFKSPINNRPSPAFNRWESAKGKAPRLRMAAVRPVDRPPRTGDIVSRKAIRLPDQHQPAALAR
jgi:hypothetical protein